MVRIPIFLPHHLLQNAGQLDPSDLSGPRCGSGQMLENQLGAPGGNKGLIDVRPPQMPLASSPEVHNANVLVGISDLHNGVLQSFLSYRIHQESAVGLPKPIPQRHVRFPAQS
jgi:hypothetical protein